MSALPRTDAPERICATRTRRPIFARGAATDVFTGLKIAYPASVIEALLALYGEHDRQLGALSTAHREWDDDYAHCTDAGRASTSWIVQIDMAGLSAEALGRLGAQPAARVMETLRGRIFEVESSWAAYRTHARAFGDEGESRYARMTLRMLDGVRERFDRPVALLAGTEAKYRSMLAGEFGTDAPPSDEEVRRVSGFDRFFGPQEFRRHLERRGGRCDYLLYVRASDSVEVLRSDEPPAPGPHALLDDPATRRLVRAHALTFNIDDPRWSAGDARRLNDTKLYMPPMGMGHIVESEDDLRVVSAALGGSRLRLKPAQGSYGCYGHLSGRSSDKRFRYAVRAGLRRWGRYLAQPELEAPTVVNDDDGIEYTYMDRVFCGIVDGRREFFGGHRLHLASNGAEARRRRLHIVHDTVFAEIDVGGEARASAPASAVR